ncbi:MAG TPA: glycosyltransferase [Steroidobacteraceae bacterium]|nr:glycosyltransferase [Steroidobacteraceae bacterium]
MIYLAALPALIWLYLLIAHGGFWRASRLLPTAAPAAPARRIVAIVPARNEADVIATAVSSLLTQQGPHQLHVIVVDDGSSDGTAATATAAAAALHGSDHLTVLAGAPLPSGWTGKLWAMAQGVEAAAARQPHYLLFTDADIGHRPENLVALVSEAERGGWALVSYMVRLSTATLAERCLIPAFVFFFFMLYPPAWVARRDAQTAAAAGGCMLVRPEVLARAGGLAAIRSRIIDDCALAALIKGAGGQLWLGLTRTAESLRPYGGFAAIGAMISRSAFNQLRHSYALLGLTLLGMLVTYVLPPVLALSHAPAVAALGIAAWALMSIAYAPMVRFYALALPWCLCLPGIAVFYAAATLHSAVQYRRGHGGRWKGRAQDVAR